VLGILKSFIVYKFFYSITLASKVAVKTSEGLDKVIRSILKEMNPEAELIGSYLDMIW
jgi:hypothetical protein